MAGVWGYFEDIDQSDCTDTNTRCPKMCRFTNIMTSATSFKLERFYLMELKEEMAWFVSYHLHVQPQHKLEFEKRSRALTLTHTNFTIVALTLYLRLPVYFLCFVRKVCR